MIHFEIDVYSRDDAPMLLYLNLIRLYSMLIERYARDMHILVVVRDLIRMCVIVFGCM